VPFASGSPAACRLHDYRTYRCATLCLRSDVVGNGSDEAKNILFQRIIPACSLMLFLGNVYFSWLATRMKTQVRSLARALAVNPGPNRTHTFPSQFGRDFTANPYGINTVGAFPFVFGIMLPVVLKGGTVTQAWQAGVAGNFLGATSMSRAAAPSCPTQPQLLVHAKSARADAPPA